MTRVKKTVEYNPFIKIEKNSSLKSYNLRRKGWVPKVPEESWTII